MTARRSGSIQAGTSTSWRPVMREAMRIACPAAQPKLYTGIPTKSMSTSSPSWLANSNQVWLRPWSEEGVPQIEVTNSVRPTSSSQIAGT